MKEDQLQQIVDAINRNTEATKEQTAVRVKIIEAQTVFLETLARESRPWYKRLIDTWKIRSTVEHNPGKVAG